MSKYTKSKYELLSPAGSFDALKAAVNAGCDAVYCGGNSFGARAYAGNFSDEELVKAIDFCHLHGKALFLTVNTLLKNNELEDMLYNYLKPLYEAGLDAVIVQDLGVLNFIHKHFPDLPLHASTQMTVLGENFAAALKKAGVSRIVTPRELSLSEIKKIYDETKLEIESFVHGALCYCYSGQCLLSSIIGGRSGNRGKCAQPCRLPYRQGNEKEQMYLFSPKDLCALEMLPDILEAGVYSLKIEGRMKNPEYVALVTSIYRKYIDLYEEEGSKNYRVHKKDFEKLLDIYNRGGFTSGFFKVQNHPSIMSTAKPNHMGVNAGIITKISGNSIFFKAAVSINKNDILELKLKNGDYISFSAIGAGNAGEICEGYIHKNKITYKQLADNTIYRTRNNSLIEETSQKYLKENSPKSKLKIDGKISIKKEQPIIFQVHFNDICAEVSFDKPQQALKQSLTKDVIFKQLNKTGNEIFDFGGLYIELDDGLFVPMGILNNIRHQALQLLSEKLLDKYKRKSVNHEIAPAVKISYVPDIIKYSCLVTNEEQLSEVFKYNEIDTIYVEQAFNDYNRLNEMSRQIKRYGKKPILAISHITRQAFMKDMEAHMDFYLENDYEGYMFRNLEAFYSFKNHNIPLKEVIFDSNIYTFNNYSYEYYKSMGASLQTAPYELNLKELKGLAAPDIEMNIYGYIPLMTTAGCINKTNKKCKENFKQTTESHHINVFDRLNNNFKVVCNCRYCYNIMYNSVPLYLYEDYKVLNNSGFERFRLNFTIENRAETYNILELFFNNSGQTPDNYTKGHLKRGV